MNNSVSYACDDEGIYEKANATPLATCTINAQRVALPKTYHHFASSGAICSAGESRTLMPNRSSSQFQTVLNSLLTGSWKWERSPVSSAPRRFLHARHSEKVEAAADRRRLCRHCNKRHRD